MRFFSKLKQDKSVVLIIDTYNHNALAEKRRIFIELLNNKINMDAENYYIQS